MPTTLETSKETQEEGFRLTGRGVLIILICVFGVIFAVNGFMVYKAIGSHPGTVTESSFRDSQRFNAEIAAAAAQTERGWTVVANATRADDGSVQIVLDARGKDGAPLTGVTFKMRLEHPAQRTLDHVVEMKPAAGSSDRWIGEAKGVTQGKWGMSIEGDGAEGRLFQSHNTVFFK
jgi:nitrogen fixation protein FixH